MVGGSAFLARGLVSLDVEGGVGWCVHLVSRLYVGVGVAWCVHLSWALKKVLSPFMWRWALVGMSAFLGREMALPPVDVEVGVGWWIRFLGPWSCFP